MRHLIVLPGNSQKNKAWGELILEHYGPQFESQFMLSYDHWVSGEGSIDFAHEEEKLRTHVATLPTETEIILFAKSAGSLLAFLTIYHAVMTPSRCVFFGIPFDLAAPELFKDAWEPVDTFSLPALAFHNVEDPTTSYDFTRNMLASHAPRIELITTHESDHWYGDMRAYADTIEAFLAQE